MFPIVSILSLLSRGNYQLSIINYQLLKRPSDMKDLEEALGQFVLYDRLLIRHAPERTLYLAVTEETRKRVFEEEAGQVLLEDGIINLVTFDPIEEVIVRWIL